MYGHYVPLIILFFSKDAENKAIKKHKLLSHSTNNLKPKKKGKLNMIRGDSKFKMGDGKRPLDVNLWSPHPPSPTLPPIDSIQTQN